jgi:hypothetical protein
MRKSIASFALFGALAVPGIALAATSSADANSYCGQPGCEQLRTPGAPGAGSQNGTGAGSGAFGPGNPGGPANGTQTGLNNSSVSGNRAGPGTQETPRDHPVPQKG